MHGTPPDHRSAAPGIADAVYQELVNLLYKQALTALFAGLAAAFGVLMALWGWIGRPYLLAWFASVIACNVYLAALMVLYRYRPATRKSVRRYDRWYNLQAILHGSAWGSLVPLAYASGSDLLLAFSVIIVVGMTSGSVIATGSVYRIFVSYILPCLLPAIVVLLFLNQGAIWTITGTLLIVYTLCIFVIGFGYYRSVHDSFRLRYENSELVSNLLAEKKRSQETLVRLEQEIGVRREAEQRITRAMEKAEAANTAKSRFLANMSHEIRTPMTAIMGFAEMLKEQRDDWQVCEHHADAIVRNGKHLLHIINDILDFSKIEAERLEMERLPVELLGLLEDVRTTFAQQAADKGVAFLIDRRFPLPRQVFTDPTRMKQILFNLVNNAIKFTASGFVRITVEYERASSRLSIAIEDSGVGMAPAELEKLFKPFTQADVSTTRRFGGTGLGLAISRRLAELLGGTLEVSSVKGAGSRFILTMKSGVRSDLELLQQAEDTPVADARPTGLSTALGGRVLVVEDNADIQSLISCYLAKWGVNMLLAGNGEQALAILREQAVDLVLMDMQMPVMDGLEATRRLRALGRTMPVVALTANALPQDRQSYLASGANDFLAKPVDQAKLQQVLKRYLSAVGASATTTAASSAAASDPQEEELQREFRQKFVAHLPEYLARINEFFSKQDVSSLLFIAHDLKGMGASFGFPAITELSARIESKIKASELENLSTDIDALNQYCAQIA